MSARMRMWEIPEAWADRPMPELGDLALFLGGSDDSFTGHLLRLMCKADLGNRRRLASVYEREDAALRAWQLLSPATYGELAAALNSFTETENGV